MNSNAFVNIALGLILIVGALVSTYVIPFLNAKVGEVELNKLISFAKNCVLWANQTIPEEEYKRKKREVLVKVIDFAKANLNIDITEEQIDTIIEALVIECKKGL